MGAGAVAAGVGAAGSIAGGLLSNRGGGSGPSGNTVSTQSSQPWDQQVPYLLGVMGSAQNLYNTGGPQYFPGPTYASPVAAQDRATTAQENLGLNGSPITGASNAAAMNILNPSFLNSNPGNAAYQDILNGGANVKSAIANAAPGLMDQFTGGQTVTPNSGASYGVGQGIGNAVANLEMQAGQGLSQNYGQAAGQQNTANMIAPSTQGLGYTDLASAYNAGGQEQGVNQNVINDALTRWNYNQTEPYNLLNWYGGAVGGNYGGTSTLSTPYFAQSGGNQFGNALSGIGNTALSAGLMSMFGK